MNIIQWCCVSVLFFGAGVIIWMLGSSIFLGIINLVSGI